MKSFLLSTIFVLGCVSSAEASRRLLIPSMRLRVDASGSNPTEKAFLYPNGPINTPLKVVEGRFRFEFSNLSSVTQHLNFYGRPGTRIGFSIDRWNYNGYDVLPVSNTPAGETMTAKTLLASVVLNPYVATGETLTTGASHSIVFAAVCDVSAAMACNSGSSDIDNANVSTIQVNNVLQATLNTDATYKDYLVKDAMLELIGNFEVEITEDRGAVAGSAGALVNRIGGYSHVLQQSQGTIPLNGGRPF